MRSWEKVTCKQILWGACEHIGDTHNFDDEIRGVLSQGWCRLKSELMPIRVKGIRRKWHEEGHWGPQEQKLFLWARKSIVVFWRPLQVHCDSSVEQGRNGVLEKWAGNCRWKLWAVLSILGIVLRAFKPKSDIMSPTFQCQHREWTEGALDWW